MNAIAAAPRVPKQNMMVAVCLVSVQASHRIKRKTISGLTYFSVNVGKVWPRRPIRTVIRAASTEDCISKRPTNESTSLISVSSHPNDTAPKNNLPTPNAPRLPLTLGKPLTSSRLNPIVYNLSNTRCPALHTVSREPCLARTRPPWSHPSAD